MLKMLFKHDLRVYMKIIYNKKDKKESIDGIRTLCIMEKELDLLLAATVTTELSILTTNSFQNHT